MVTRTGWPFLDASSAVCTPGGRVLTAAAVPLTMGVTEEVEVASCLKSRVSWVEEFWTMPSLVSTMPPYSLALAGTGPLSATLVFLLPLTTTKPMIPTMMRTTASTPSWSQRRLAWLGLFLACWAAIWRAFSRASVDMPAPLVGNMGGGSSTSSSLLRLE